MKNQRIKLERIIKISTLIPTVLLAIFLLSGCSSDNYSDNNIDANINKKTSTVQETQEKKFIPIPGDDVLLKYDKETEEKIYITNSLQNYDALVKSYEIKDNEARQELILNGNIMAVKNGTRARVLELAESNGAEKIRILEGEHYNYVGYVPYTLMREAPSNK